MAETPPSANQPDLEHLLKLSNAEILKREATILQMQHKIGVLEAQVRRLLRGRFTPTSETIIPDPLQQRIDEIVPIPGDAPVPLIELPPSANKASQPRNKPRRRPLSEMYPDLVVNECHITLPPEERFDSDGTPLIHAGVFTNEQLVWHPTSPSIRRNIRHRYGRSDTGEKITAAPVVPCITPRGILADETIHSLVISHVLDALPWHRQEIISDRAGCRIPRSVMTSGWAVWCQLMAPLAQAIRSSLLAKPVLAADSTVIRHQDGEIPLRCSTTAIWAITDGAEVFYHWTEDLCHHRVLEVLGGYTGTLIRDEWEGWKKLLQWMPEGDPPPPDPQSVGNTLPPVDLAGCHSHSRRRFVDLKGIDPRADAVLELYRRLYAIEREAVEQWIDGEDLVDARLSLRKGLSVPIWDLIVRQANGIVDHMSPATALYQAANYIVKYRVHLDRCMSDGRLPIDNNMTENILRIVAIIRKNRLFLGRSDDAGPNLATGLTILRSCTLAGLNPLDYLAKITPTLLEYRRLVEAGGIRPDLTGLTPLALAAQGNARRFGASSIAVVV
jgi:transposase